MSYFKSEHRSSFFNLKFLNLALALLVILISGVGCGEKGTSKMSGSPVGDAVVSTTAESGDTIKVGILHSLSGTMAISETSLKDVALMAIEEINAKGGVLGKKLEPVVVDPASNWPLFAEKARELIQKQKVAVTFGCWTSGSRKSVLPVFEELNGFLLKPASWIKANKMSFAGLKKDEDRTSVILYLNENSDNPKPLP